MATFANTSPTTTDAARTTPRFDPFLLLATGLLILVGLMSIYSVGTAHGGDKDFRKQILYILIGAVPFSIFAFTNPRFWMRIVNVLYVGNVLALGAVLAFGKTTKGAQRWIEFGGMQFQPSEMAKLITAITLAAFFAKRMGQLDKPSTTILSLAHLAVPAGLIFVQPHLGSVGVLFGTWVAIAIIAGVPWKHLFIIFLAIGGLIGGLTFKPIRDRVLTPYQIERIDGLLAGGADAQKKNYQTEQAKRAFANGGVLGSGYLKGEQKQGGFVPEQRNDFIFTVPGEEAGFVGGVLILALYGFFFYRVWLVMVHAEEPYFRMIVGGIYTVLGFHMCVNIAMVLQLIPVVGLWLPFMSSGGTAMWLCLSCVGLLVGIRRHERPVLF